MRGRSKSKAQLLGEMADMRRRIAEFEASHDKYKTAEETIRAYAGQLDILREIHHAILLSQPVRAITEAVLEQLQQLVPCVWVGVAEFDFGTNEATVLAARSSSRTLFPAGAHIPMEDFGLPRALPRGEVLVVKDILAVSKPTRLDRTFQNEGARSYISVPLVSHERVIGFLDFYAKEPDAFASGHVQLVSEVGALLAIAIRHERGEEVRARERCLLRSLMDTLRNCHVFVKDTEGRFIMANTHYLKALGARTLDEVIGKTDFAFFPAKIAERHSSEEQKVVLSGEALVEGEERVVDRKGRTRSLLTTKVPLRDELGGVMGVVGISTDITNGKDVQDKLRESESLYRALFEHAPLGIGLATREGKVLRCNDAMLRLTGYSEAEIRRVKLQDTYQNPQERSSLLKKLVTGGCVHDLEVTLKRKDGTPYSCCLTIAPITLGGKQLLLTIAQDVTERKQAEQARKEAEIEIRSMLSSMDDLVFRLDPEGRFVFCHNPEHPDLYLPLTSFIGKKHAEVMPSRVNELFSEAWEKVRNGKGAEYEYWLKVQDDVRWYHVKLSPMFLGAKFVGSVAVVRNITDRKRKEEQLVSYQDQLRSLASQLSLAEEQERRRIATLLHDSVCQALATSKIKLETLCESNNSAGFVGRVNEVQELLDQALSTSRSLTFELSPPVLYELGLEAALEWLREHVQEQHGIRCVFEDDGKPKPLEEDVRVVIFQAVRELMANVAKHARAKTAKVSVGRDGDNIRIRVVDDGIGFNVAKTLCRTHGTTGFGLFSVRERLGHLGGRLEVRSQPGKGTCITLVAPLKQGERRKRGQSSENKDSPG